MRNILTALLTACILSPVMAGAQDSTSLDPVTVTASSSPEKSSRTGRNVFVISGDRFLGLPVHSIDELLRYLPGIEVQARGPMGSQSDLVIRGGTFQQVLVILDGLRLNDPNTGHFTGNIPIAPSEIERIEILKGASSAIYGSDAVGGVIHIITKTFSAKHGAASKKFQGQVTAGSYDLFSLQAGAFYSNGNTSVGAGLLSNNTSGQPQRGTHGSVYAHSGSVSLGHHFNERYEMKMRYSYDERNFSAQNFYTNFVSDTASEKLVTHWNQLGFVYHGSLNRISLNVGYKTLEDRFQFNSTGLPNKSNSKLLQALLTDEWNVRSGTRLVTGLQFVNKRIASNDRGEHEVNQSAAFAILNQQIGQNFFASPALRLEYNNKAGWELIPQLNLSYQIQKVQIRGSVGKTIRDADFTERYNNYQKALVTSGRIGNPSLEEEHSISFEAGADYYGISGLKLSGSFFQRFHSQLIDYVTTPYSEMPRKDNLSPTGTYALARNISKVTTTGVETELQYQHSFHNDHSVWATAGLTWLQSESSLATPSFYISSHAKWLANFNLQYRIHRLGFSLNGVYKIRSRQAGTAVIAGISRDYFILNAKAEAMVLQDRLSLFVQADNIFDRQYADLLGAQMPGRWMMGGLKIILPK